MSKWVSLKGFLVESYRSSGEGSFPEFARKSGLTDVFLRHCKCFCEQDGCSETNEEVASRLAISTASWASTRSQVKAKLAELECPSDLLPISRRGQGRKGQYNSLDSEFSDLLAELDEPADELAD